MFTLKSKNREKHTLEYVLSELRTTESAAISLEPWWEFCSLLLQGNLNKTFSRDGGEMTFILYKKTVPLKTGVP